MVWEAAGGTNNGLGTGGMLTKLQAADLALTIWHDRADRGRCRRRRAGSGRPRDRDGHMVSAGGQRRRKPQALHPLSGGPGAALS